MYSGRRACVILCSLLFVGLCACSDAASRYREPGGCELSALRWQKADRLFRSDDRWLGGDGAYSVDLGSDRVLWLFGDSFIGRGDSRDRNSAVVVRNTVAIQKGYDPSRASASFYWNTVQDGPEAFFRSPGPFWYWPGGGVVVEHRLLVFLMEIQAADNELGFQATGWTAVLVNDPWMEPSQWDMNRLEVPRNDFGVIIGSAGGMVIDGYLYAFGAHTVDHGAYLVRWALSDAARGKMMHLQWWTSEGGWVDHNVLTHRPQPLFRDAQMEFTIHYEEAVGGFMQVQTGSFPQGCLVYRLSRDLTGPWSEKKSLYCPREAREPQVLFYACKAHPCLKGADLWCTYALNSLDENRLLNSHDLYYPAFVRVMMTSLPWKPEEENKGIRGTNGQTPHRRPLIDTLLDMVGFFEPGQCTSHPAVKGGNPPFEAMDFERSKKAFLAQPSRPYDRDASRIFHGPAKAYLCKANSGALAWSDPGRTCLGSLRCFGSGLTFGISCRCPVYAGLSTREKADLPSADDLSIERKRGDDGDERGIADRTFESDDPVHGVCGRKPGNSHHGGHRIL